MGEGGRRNGHDRAMIVGPTNCGAREARHDAHVTELLVAPGIMAACVDCLRHPER